MREKCKLCGRRAPGTPKKTERDEEIRQSELSVIELAKKYRLSRARVYQILNEE